MLIDLVHNHKLVAAAVCLIAVACGIFLMSSDRDRDRPEPVAPEISSSGKEPTPGVGATPINREVASPQVGLAHEPSVEAEPAHALTADVPGSPLKEFNPMWGRTAEEIPRQPSSQPESPRRVYFDAIATGRWSMEELQFDVTYRGAPGEETVSIVNLDLEGLAAGQVYDRLSSAFALELGQSSVDVNDENGQFRLTRETWAIDGGTVSLTYGDDFIGEDSISIEYRRAP